MSVIDRRRGRGEWITGAQRVGRRLLYVWIVIGWVLVIPAFVYGFRHGYLP